MEGKDEENKKCRIVAVANVTLEPQECVLAIGPVSVLKAVSSR